MASLFKVNLIGIFLSACAYILLGIIFYSHWILGIFWPDLVKHMQKQAANIYVYFGSVLSAVLIAYGMGCILNLLNVKSLSSGFFIGLLIWAGFILPTIFSPVLFGKKPLGMFWLDAIYYLLAYILIGIITAKFNS